MFWPLIYAILLTAFILHLDHNLIPRASKKYLHEFRLLMLYFIGPMLVTVVIAVFMQTLIPRPYGYLMADSFIEKGTAILLLATFLSAWLLRTRGVESSGGHMNLNRKRIALVIVLYTLILIFHQKVMKPEMESSIQFDGAAEAYK